MIHGWSRVSMPHRALIRQGLQKIVLGARASRPSRGATGTGPRPPPPPPRSQGYSRPRRRANYLQTVVDTVTDDYFTTWTVSSRKRRTASASQAIPPVRRCASSIRLGDR